MKNFILLFLLFTGISFATEIPNYDYESAVVPLEGEVYFYDEQGEEHNVTVRLNDVITEMKKIKAKNPKCSIEFIMF